MKFFSKARSITLDKTKTALAEKLRESAVSVIPIIVIVALLCLCVLPMSTDLLLAFLVGAIMIVAGMGLFSLGAEQSMTPIGNKIGTALTKTKNLPLIIGVSFLLGFAVTVAEPDLQVLAETVPNINKTVLLVTVGVGVGLFMSFCMVRILYGLSLRWVLIVCYAVIFILAAFSDKNYLCIAFDSGGVTTGPMTVPFILALGVGVSNVRSDKRAEADSFGLVALCSIGPILSVLILGFLGSSAGSTGEIGSAAFGSTKEIGTAFLRSLPANLKEMAVAMLPIVVIFLVFQFVSFRMSLRSFAKISVGIVYTYIGLVLFLTGVNVGFMPVGTELGRTLASLPYRWCIVPIGMVIGYFIVMAEPAVHVLTHQVEEMTSGAIPAKAMSISLSAGVAISLGLAMVRVLTGLSILWFLVPGYAAAIAMSFFVPKMFTAIAFDSGGVASGPMTATFLLPFAIGACQAVGGDIVRDAFGIVAMVAMTPLITIQVLGLLYRFGGQKTAPTQTTWDIRGDYEIIEL